MEDIDRIVLPDEEGERLDRALVALGGGLARSEVQRQIRAGRVLVDAEPALQPSRRLRAGERILWRVAPEAALTPRDLGVPVLYEDAALVVVDKPVGLVVHPGAGTTDTTLVEALLVGRDLPASDDPARPGIVHRLDKETSGVLVVAKTAEALASLQRQFAERAVEKNYLALVGGVIAEDEGRIDAPIGRDPAVPRRMSIQAGGRAAHTVFRVLSRERDRTYLLVRPLTGRTHQVRVHFRYIGHPVLGDDLYGGPAARRLGLHAWRLTIRHPVTGDVMTFEAAPPQDFPACDYAALRDSDLAAM
ncbi:MAG: RluA family pseudouridine synthase [Candidatus Bipolaricaulis sp.]|nr:RluA family pseudouridine synthase [Candidatus Bipolaricaulis sp.]